MPRMRKGICLVAIHFDVLHGKGQKIMNPLDAAKEWEAEQQAKPGHPSYPFRDEEAHDLARCRADGGHWFMIMRIKAIWGEKRDRLFPNWRSDYNTDFAEWLKGQH